MLHKENLKPTFSNQKSKKNGILNQKKEKHVNFQNMFLHSLKKPNLG